MTSPIAPSVERRRPMVNAVSESLSSSKFYIICAIGLSIVTVLAVLAVILWQPDNMVAINIIIGITAPTIVGLMGAGGIGMLKVLDGNQNKLMAAIARMERAEGLIQGLRENPNTNIEVKKED